MSDKRGSIRLESVPVARQNRQKFPSRSLFFLLVGAGVSLWLWAHVSARGSLNDPPTASRQWSWSDIEPRHDLRWEDCYDGLKCARLQVPIDWQDMSDKRKLTLGVIKLPAKTKDSSLPPLFFNPGGPGGSGVDALQKFGSSLQAIAGDNYDIISWDPRGVGVSVPRVECWGDAQKREAWLRGGIFVMDPFAGSSYEFYARQEAFSKHCEAILHDTNILPYLSTAYHARDMLEILQKTGHQKLHYWGISYGTILGGFFAALYPERVERLVSDGNVNYSDYLHRNRVNFVEDADKIFDAFDAKCHSAGPEKCALWANTAEGVTTRRANVLELLKTRPVIIPAWAAGNGPEMPEIITYSKLQALMRGIIYRPARLAEKWAKIYAGLEKGDGLPYYDMVTNGGKDPMWKQPCGLVSTPATTPLEVQQADDAFRAISCTDGALNEKSPEEWHEFVKAVTEKSKWVGAASAVLSGVCIGWTTKSRWPFTEDDFRKDTAFPILYIGNTADNITPLSAAYNNSARFPSSVVLEQHAYGHSTLAAPSTCTVGHIKAYFQDGVLPPRGTRCEPDFDFFEYPQARADSGSEMADAVWELAENMDLSRLMTV